LMTPPNGIVGSNKMLKTRNGLPKHCTPRPFINVLRRA
jgi:hypothetical protein